MRIQVHRDGCAIANGHQSQIETLDGKDFEMEGVYQRARRQSEGYIRSKDKAKGPKKAHATAAHEFTEVCVRECHIQHSLDLTDEMVEYIRETVK